MANDNKTLESLYSKVLLKENSYDIAEEIPKDSDEEEFDALNDEEVDPLSEDDNTPDKNVRMLVAAITHLIHRWDNVVDGARSEKDFIKTLQQLMPEVKAILNKVDIR